VRKVTCNCSRVKSKLLHGARCARNDRDLSIAEKRRPGNEARGPPPLGGVYSNLTPECYKILLEDTEKR